MVFTPPAAASLDGTPVAAFGTSTSLASGNITTTGTDGVAFGFYAEYGADLGSEQINGVALARKQGATGLRGELWQIAYSAGFTGQATATLGVSAPWIGGVIAFKAAAGGGQIARPVSDVSVGNWTASSGTDRYAMVDEETASDTDYITSGAAPANDACVLALGALSTPVAGTVTLRVRAKYV
jgi:hypothetical protein